MTWNDGSVYEGEFDRGTRHGRGELRLSDGFIYSGSWDTNYMEGRGMSIFPDGQEYQVRLPSSFLLLTLPGDVQEGLA
jgi:hypothetical protein